MLSVNLLGLLRLDHSRFAFVRFGRWSWSAPFWSIIFRLLSIDQARLVDFLMLLDFAAFETQPNLSVAVLLGLPQLLEGAAAGLLFTHNK